MVHPFREMDEEVRLRSIEDVRPLHRAQGIN
jgi:hypothetical protein